MTHNKVMEQKTYWPTGCQPVTSNQGRGQVVAAGSEAADSHGHLDLVFSGSNFGFLGFEVGC